MKGPRNVPQPDEYADLATFGNVLETMAWRNAKGNFCCR
jgi:hypothetical protein